MDILRLVGRNIRNRRLELGWTQEELADKCELDQRFISGVENGRRNVTVMKLQRIAATLKVEIAELFIGRPAGDGQSSNS